MDRERRFSKSFVLSHLNKDELVPIIKQHVSPTASVITDRASFYQCLHDYFPRHAMVKHSVGEYVNRHDPTIHINTVEGAFTMMKRGRFGTYQQWSSQHADLYVAEFEFRSNYHNRSDNDLWLIERSLMGTIGKRMTYRQTQKGLKSLIN